MKIYPNNGHFIAVADEGKKFLFNDGTLFHLCERATEEELIHLTEVPVVDGVIVDEEIFTRRNLLHELKEIREWFASTDYIPNKVTVGEWSADDPRFIEYCENRKSVRERQDEVYKLLGLPV